MTMGVIEISRDEYSDIILIGYIRNTLVYRLLKLQYAFIFLLVIVKVVWLKSMMPASLDPSLHIFIK